MRPEHFRPAGQITDRLLADPNLTLDGWYPTREAALRTSCRPAAVRHRIGRRKRRKRTPFVLALLNLTGPSIALILVLGVTQAERLLYVAAVLP